MSRKTNVNNFVFGKRETGLLQMKYNTRSATAFRTLSPNTSSSSDSFDDSFEQIYKPLKKSGAPTTDSNTTSIQREVESSASMSAKNNIGQEECDELDELFKNIDLKDTIDKIPTEWLEDNEHPNTVGLSTVYEGGESKYRSSKSVNSSTLSKDSAHFELSQDSLNNLVKPSETSKDSLDTSYVTSNNVLPLELNDTLEDVEYVWDEKNRYLLKPVSKTAKIPTSVPACSSVDSSVIQVDSSPDTSYVTAHNELKVIDVKDIKTETLNVKSSLSYCTLTSVDSNENISLASTVTSTHFSFTTAKNDFKLIDTDDIKSEYSCDKTSSTSDGKTNSWTTLDSSENASTAPMTDERNDSLVIAKNKLKSAEQNDDAKSETSGEGQMFTCITYPKTASFFEVDEDKTIDSDVAKTSEYFTAAATNDSSLSTNQLNVSAARYNTLDDVPSFSTDSTVSSVNHSNNPQNTSTSSGKHFNDSLERIEYMMKKGLELQQKTCEKSSAARVANSPDPHYKMPTPKALTSSPQKRTFAGPKTPAKLFTNSAKKPIQPSPQAVTPSTRILKPFNRAQSAKSQPTDRKFTPPRASPTMSPAFKRPNFPTSGTKKEPIQSRIPSSKNKHFEHIVSPIGAYIKNIAAPPLLANVKPTTDFFDSSYCNKMSKELDHSVMSDAGASKPCKLVSSLPVKFFTSSQQQRVIDEKFQKIPGGEKLNRIIGQMPSVISHQGRIHSGNPVKRIVPTDDSFANVSVMSGDISVQVVRDVKRQ